VAVDPAAASDAPRGREGRSVAAVRLPFGLRWWELLPEAVLVAGLGFFALTEWSAARSAFKSTTAIALMAGTTVAWIAARVLLARVPWPAVRLAVLGAAAVAVLSIVVLPAFDDETVVEALPAAEVTPPPSTPRSIDGSATTTTAAPQPVALRSSAIHGIDHDASGTVVLYRQPGGALLVGLEDIDIQPGPDYDVYVVPGADQEGIDGATRLDDLRGNKGTQYYEVPDDTDLSSGAWTVLVWCETFDVPVAGATPV